MTKDEILAASPEQLRVMVATALGCTVMETDKGPICGCDPDEKDGWPHWDPENPYGLLYNWPNDIGTAWELVEDANERGWLVLIYPGKDNCACRIGTGYAFPEKTVPLAICRAWLLANLKGEK